MSFLNQRHRPAGLQRGIAAFTLIELIVVVVIIAVLAALSLQVIGRISDSSREARGLANLRQIGTTVSIHVAETSGFFPYGLYSNLSGSPFSDWALFLTTHYLEPNPRFNYMGGAVRHSIFQDPSATFPDQGTLHFAAHPLLFVANTSGGPVPAVRVARPAHTVMVMDAGQNPASGSSYARAVNVPGINSEPTVVRYNEPVPITVGNNADSNFGAGSVRWRAQHGNAAKFLFVDGHVEVMSRGELQYRHIWIDEP